MGRIQRVALVAACLAFGAATCGTALALHLNVNTASAPEETKAAPAAPKSLNVPSGVMAGNVVTRPEPIYPEAAKKAKIQGTVVLNATIGKEGTITDLEAIAGPEELRQSSLDAVRQWTYKPYLLNGDPVEVQTQINITYLLGK